MVTRDLTSRFLQLRYAIRGMDRASVRSDPLPPHAEDAPLRAMPGSADAERPPVWVATVDLIHEVEAAIRSRMGRLRELHTAHLKPQFSKDEETEERAITALTAEIKQLFSDAEQAIKRMVVSEGDLTGKTIDQQKLLQNVQLALVTQMSELSKSFGDEQRKYLSEVRKQKDRAKKLVKFGSRTAEEEEEDRREMMMEQYMERGFTAEQVQALDFNEQMITERDAELQHIYSSIVDLHDVFKDLHALVIDQGTLLDRIDYNVEETKQQVSRGTAELHRLHQRQKRSKFVGVVVSMVASIFGLLLLLILRSMLR